jgi:hypothetical protein
MRRAAPAIALFFLSPLIAEFLLGDFTLAALGYLLFLAPMYGGGAVLIREVVRRTGRGWPSMVVLALAYGVFEEGITTQSLFNPDYAHHHLLGKGFLPGLGIALPWTLYVLALHTVWSMSVPIALTEEWTDRRTVPWLRTPGLVVATVLFVVGAVVTTLGSYANGRFMASWPQLITVAVVTLALIVAAFAIPRRAAAAPVLPAGTVSADSPAGSAGSPGPAGAKVAPAPWTVLALTLAAGALIMLSFRLDAVPGVLGMLVAFAGVTAAIRAWSKRAGWDGRHRLAAAAGAVLTYAWHSFTLSPLGGDGPIVTPVSKVVFALAAVVLLGLEAQRVRRRRASTADREAVEALAH